MAKTKRRLSDAERAERRRADRERLQAATEELLSSQGWQRWVRARALFHSYSLTNSLLLAVGCINSVSCCGGFVFVDEAAEQVSSAGRHR